jgi:hypothetical protein
VIELAAQVENFPRHLGIHSGGMVLCDRPVIEVCPVEWGRMADRSVFDTRRTTVLEQGMRAIEDSVMQRFFSARTLASANPVAESVRTVLLATNPVGYAGCCAADSIGVFQVESRAQMATLPRLKPRSFYDLVVEVALIRPGPIQGGSVHPYIRRRNGTEPVTYLHPLLESSLSKTLGVPLFQEQLMQMAIDVAGFTPGESDQLRQAMGSKRSRSRMAAMRERPTEGMAERASEGDIADRIFEKMAAFANFGFPESHSVSFAYLVYASSWIKLHEPAAFCAALLNAQPMGFYSPHTLVQDANRHGVIVRTPDINASDAQATLEPCEESHNGVAVRLGIDSVRHVGTDLGKAIAEGRPYSSMEDLTRRTGATLPVLEALATAGAFGCFDDATGDGPMTRRSALWSAGAVVQSRPDRLAGVVLGADAPTLPGMSAGTPTGRRARLASRRKDASTRRRAGAEPATATGAGRWIPPVDRGGGAHQPRRPPSTIAEGGRTAARGAPVADKPTAEGDRPARGDARRRRDSLARLPLTGHRGSTPDHSPTAIAVPAPTRNHSHSTAPCSATAASRSCQLASSSSVSVGGWGVIVAATIGLPSPAAPASNPNVLASSVGGTSPSMMTLTAAAVGLAEQHDRLVLRRV